MRFGFFFLFYWYLPHPYTHNGYHSLIISTLVSEMAFNECDCIGFSNLFDEIYVTKPNTINIVHPFEKTNEQNPSSKCVSRRNYSRLCPCLVCTFWMEKFWSIQQMLNGNDNSNVAANFMLCFFLLCIVIFYLMS